MSKIDELRKEQDDLFNEVPTEHKDKVARMLNIEYALAMVEEGHDINDFDHLWNTNK